LIDRYFSIKQRNSFIHSFKARRSAPIAILSANESQTIAFYHFVADHELPDVQCDQMFSFGNVINLKYWQVQWSHSRPYV